MILFSLFSYSRVYPLLQGTFKNGSDVIANARVAENNNRITEKNAPIDVSLLGTGLTGCFPILTRSWYQSIVFNRSIAPDQAGLCAQGRRSSRLR